VPREASVGTNASHDEGVLWKRDAVAEEGARADTALRTSRSVKCRCKTAHTPSIQLRRAGCQPNFRVGLCGRGISVRIRIGICPVFGSGAQTRCASKATFFPRLCNAESSQRFCKSRGRAADYETFWVPQIAVKTGNGSPPRAPGETAAAEVEQVFEQVAPRALSAHIGTIVVQGRSPGPVSRRVPPRNCSSFAHGSSCTAAQLSYRGASATGLWRRRGAQ